MQWTTDTDRYSGLPKRRVGEGRFGPREMEAQQIRQTHMQGHGMSEVMTPRLTVGPPGSQQYEQMVSDLKQLKHELESVPLSQLGTQLDELMGTTPRSARSNQQTQTLHGVAAPRAADVRGRRGPNGQFFYK